MSNKKFSDADFNQHPSWDEHFGGVKAKCHFQHPVLSVGGGLLCGASAQYPRSGFDVYVGLDREMAASSRAYPWYSGDDRSVCVHFPIIDYAAPKDPESFKELCQWVCNQLQKKKKVHVGCVGGHGRTGTVMAGVMALLGEKDAIGWVRKNHCKRAVESDVQVDFLVKYFGVTPHSGCKVFSQAPGYKIKYSYSDGHALSFDSSGVMITQSHEAYNDSQKGKGTSGRVFTPVASKKCIWKK